MVLPTSAADAGDAEAQAWLGKVLRQLALSQRRILIALPGAAPTQLGAVVRALSKCAPWDDQGEEVLEVCLRAPEVVALKPGSRVLLRVHAEDLTWLNLYRPVFADRELRVVLWISDAILDGLIRQAVDFFDWVSRIVLVPSKPLPDF